MSDLSLTIPRGLAARRYCETYDRSQRTVGSPERRLMAGQAHDAATKALTPPQFAVLKLLILRGQSLSEVATKAGRSVSDIAAVLDGALDVLIGFYRITDQAEAA